MAIPAQTEILRPEQRLLVAAARTRIDPVVAERIETLCTQTLDWDYLLELSGRHGVVPLVQTSLCDLNISTIPTQVLDKLRIANRRIAQHNLARTRELLQILALLEDNGVPAIPFKGPTLAIQAYGDLRLRQFADLDILIRQRDFPMARELMISQGYLPSKAFGNLQEIASYPYRGHHEYRMFNPGGQLVELEWQVLQLPFAFPPQPDAWWNELSQLQVAGRTVRCLSPQHLLLILCVHGSKHLWERLIWLCDIAELVARDPAIEWKPLLENARSLGALRMLLLGLALAQSLLDAPLPPEVQYQIRVDTQLPTLARLALQQLWSDGPMSTDVAARRPLYLFSMLERFRDRAAVAIRHLPSMLNPRRVYQIYGMDPIRQLLGLGSKRD